MSVIYGIPFIILGGKTIATISVSYPVGSTCSCSDGKKTLIAADTTGSTVFEIPYVGTWVISCTNGSKTASKSVSITTEGQTETVKLAYEYVLYESGTKNVTFTEKSNWAAYGSISWGTKNITIEMPSDSGGWYLTICMNTPKIDLSSYSLLRCTLSSLEIESTNSLQCFSIGVSSASDPDWQSKLVASKTLTYDNNSSKQQTVDVDISSVSSGVIQTGVAGGQGYSVTAVITKIWLE